MSVLSENVQERWWLATQLPPLTPSVSVALEIIREVAGQELIEINKANSLIGGLARVAPYAKLVDLFRQLQQAATSDERRSAQRMTTDMNRAAIALSVVAKNFLGDIRSQVSNDFGDDSEELQRFDLAAAEECSNPAFRLLVGIAELDAGPFQASADGIKIAPVALTSLTAIEPNLPPNAQLVPILFQGMMTAQRLIGRHLKLYAAEIEKASYLLRRLAAEVPDGAPGIIRADELENASSSKGLGNITPVPLALGDATMLHRALRLADVMLASYDGQAMPRAAEALRTTGPESEQAPAAEPDAANKPDKPDTAASDQDESTASRQQQPAQHVTGQATDLTALAAHATDLADSLERAWSAALSPESLGPAHADLNAKFTSLMSAINSQVTETENALRKAGVNARLGVFPTSLQEIEQLSLDPDAAQQWRQAIMAQIDALALTLEALNAMRSPSAYQVDLHTGIKQTWWEAGAFAMLRDRANLLTRLAIITSEAAKSMIDGNPTFRRATVRSIFDTLRSAGDALSHGNAIGAIFLARLAMIERAAVDLSWSDTGANKIPQDLPERLAADSRLAAEAPLIRIIEDMLKRFVDLEDVDIALAVLVAPHAIRLAERLCFREPTIIDAVLRATESAGRNDNLEDRAADVNVSSQQSDTQGL